MSLWKVTVSAANTESENSSGAVQTIGLTRSSSVILIYAGILSYAGRPGFVPLSRICRMRAAPLVQLFHWNAEEAKGLVKTLEASGYEVALHSKGGGLSARAMASAAAVVIDLTRLPSQGRAVAAWLRGSKSTRTIPIVFVNGDADKVARVKQDVPDAVYASSKSVVGVLKKVKSPTMPVIPRQMMASTRSTAAKLGIRENTRVALIDAPAHSAQILGELPKGVTVLEGSEGPAEVTLWFVHDVSDYERKLPSRRTLAVRSRLWILWKKGRQDGLNGNRVRNASAALGLVDYKICSLDGVWSGMAFAVRKAK